MSAVRHSAVDLFDEFRRDWEAALNPCMMCLLEKCPEGERDALDALLDNWMGGCETPPYSPVQMRRLEEKIAPLIDRAMADPAVMAHLDQVEAAWRDKPWVKKRWLRLRSKVIWAWVTRPRPFRKQRWE